MGKVSEKKWKFWLVPFLALFLVLGMTQVVKAADEYMDDFKLFVQDWTAKSVVRDVPGANQSDGKAVVDDDGNVIVAWIDNGNVYVQKMSPLGIRQWNANGNKVLDIAGAFTDLDICYIGSGEVVIAARAGTAIRVQRVSTDGVILWPGLEANDGISLGVADATGTPQVVFDGSDLVVVGYNPDGSEVLDDNDLAVRGVKLDTTFVYDKTAILTDANQLALGLTAPVLATFKLVQGNTGYIWAVAAYNGADDASCETAWVARAIGANGGLQPVGEVEIDHATDGAANILHTDPDEFSVTTDGAGGAIAVGVRGTAAVDNDYGIYMNGVKSNGATWNAGAVATQVSAAANLSNANCQLYGAPFMEEGTTDYMALLWSENAGAAITLQKFKIATTGFAGVKWDCDPATAGNQPFDVDAWDLDGAISLDGNAEGLSAKMANLGGGKVGFTWDEAATEDIYALVVGNDSAGTAALPYFNDEDVGQVIATTGVTNTQLLAGSAYSLVLDTSAVDRYDLSKFSSELSADIKFETNPTITPDQLNVNQANTITVIDQLKNNGQLAATDITVNYYLTSQDNKANFDASAQKILLGSRTVTTLDPAEIEDGNPSVAGDQTVATELSVTADQTRQAMNWNLALYIAGYANEPNISSEALAYRNNNWWATAAIGDINGPDFQPLAGINVGGANINIPVNAGETITVSGARIINNDNDQDAENVVVGFYYSRADTDVLATLLAHATTEQLAEYTITDIDQGVTVIIPNTSVTIPLDAQNAGNGPFIYVVPDPENVIGETTEDNNVNNVEGTGMVELTVTGYPDLELNQLLPNIGQVDPGGMIDINWVATNNGGVNADPTPVLYYLSEDDTLDIAVDRWLGSGMISDPFGGPINPAETTGGTTQNIPIPSGVTPGEYYLFGSITALPTEQVTNNNVNYYYPLHVGVLPPTPTITAAYVSGTLTLTLDLGPGDQVGTDADWWLAAFTPFGTYWYDGVTWVSGASTAYQGALFTLTDYVVTTGITLPSGTYNFCFAVDLTMDGALNSLYYACDTVVVP